MIELPRTIILLKSKRDAELDDMANAVFHANKTLGNLIISLNMTLLDRNVVKGCVSEMLSPKFFQRNEMVHY